MIDSKRISIRSLRVYDLTNYSASFLWTNARLGAVGLSFASQTEEAMTKDRDRGFGSSLLFGYVIHFLCRLLGVVKEGCVFR